MEQTLVGKGHVGHDSWDVPVRELCDWTLKRLRSEELGADCDIGKGAAYEVQQADWATVCNLGL